MIIHMDRSGCECGSVLVLAASNVAGVYLVHLLQPDI
jgi:hypothetical protein